MRKLTTFIFMVLVSTVWAQEVTNPPAGSKGYGAPVKAPDGEILVGNNGSFTYISRKAYVDSLQALGYTKTQVDSAITAQIDTQSAFNIIPVTQIDFTDKAINVKAFDNTGMSYQEGNIDLGVTRDSPHTMGRYAFKQGVETEASGNFSSAFGSETTASGNFSSAFGDRTTASGNRSAAFGFLTTASGTASSAFGDRTTASGNRSAAFGQETTASGSYSLAFGFRSIANEYASLAIGQHSTDGAVETSWTPGSPIFKVGNGTGTGNRSNAYVLNNDGTSTQYGIASYGADYSANFTDRSLVDKEYVDSLFKLGYTNAQVDSAITAQIGGINFPVTSVNSMTGDVTIAPTDLGLGNVDNTSDADKPVSTAQQNALDGKENVFSKGSLVAGTGVTLGGTLTNRLVGSGDVTINASNPLTASNGLQINSGVISPVYGTSANTVAQGNDSRINNGQTAYGWGDHNLMKYLTGTSTGPTVDAYTGNYNDLGSGMVYGQGSPNYPGSNGIVLTGRVATGYGVQFHGNVFSDRWYGRRLNNNVWQSWVEFWHSGNFTPPVAFTRSVNGLVPSPGGSGSTRYLREDGTWAVPDGGGGGGTATDLSIQNRTATTLQIGSSTGTAATVPIATTSLAGLLSATDKVKLNGLTSYSAGNGINISSGAISATFGTSSGTVAQGNDSRINNGQTAYGWGNHAQQKYLSAASTTSTGMVVDDYNGDLNDLYSGFGYAGSSATNKPGAGDGHVITIRQSASIAAQIYAYAGGDQWLLRKNQGGTWSPWHQIWHSGNFSPSDYVTSTNFTWSNLSGKPSTFAPAPHSHNASDINAGTLAIARIPTGTTGSTVALGNHTHTFAQITSKPTTLSGYGITNGVASTRNVNSGSGLTGGGNLTQDRTLSVVFGTGSGTVAQGNDSRINNGQTAYNWGNFRDFGLGSTAVTLNSLAEANDASRGSYFMVATTGANTPFSQFGTGLHMRYGTNRAFQVWYNMGGGAPQYRSSDSGGNWDNIETFWTTSNLTNPASFGTTNSTVRNNQQLDARYVQSIGAGSGISVSGTTVSVDNTVVRTSGNQTIGGTKTLSSPPVAPQYQGTSTTASSSIPTNTQSLFKASRSSGISYTLTNMSGNPRHIQVMVTNTSSEPFNVTFNANMSTTSQNPTVPGNSTVIFTFLVENGTAWGTKTTF